MFPVDYFSRRQIKRGKEIYYKPQISQRVHRCSTLPHEQPQSTRLTTHTSGMAGIAGPQRCLLPHTNQTQSPKVSRLHFQSKAILLSGPTLRAQRSTLHIHKGTTPPFRDPAPPRHSCRSIPRRLDSMGGFTRSRHNTSIHSHQHPRYARFSDQHQEVSAHTKSRLRMARSAVVPPAGHVGHSPSKAERAPSIHLRGPQGHYHNPPHLGTPTRFSELCYADPLPVTAPTTAPPIATVSRPFTPKRPTKTASPKIERLLGSLAQPAGFAAKRNIRHRQGSHPRLDRRFSESLGGTYNVRKRSRKMAQRAQSPHKPARSESSQAINSGIGTLQQTRSSIHRQRTGPMLHQQALMQIESTTDGDQSPHCDSQVTTAHDKGTTYIHAPERPSRHSQPHSPSHIRMGAPYTGLSGSGVLERPVTNRPHGNQGEHKDTNLRQSPSRSKGSGNQCSSPGLEQMDRNLPIPAQMVHTADNSQATVLQTPRSNNSPVVPSGTLVPIYSEPSNQGEKSTITGSNERWTARLREVDRLQFLKEVYEHSMGGTVASALISAHRPSTIKQAQSVWKAFQQWLPASITTISEKTVMEFLLFCEESKHLDPRTILNYRSQLRLPILQAFGINLSSDNFSLLARSQFLRNPPKKQIVPSWSIDRAIDTFSNREFEADTASPENLLLKALFLTALASGNRASELAATIRTGISLSKTGGATLPVKPGFLFKNQNPKNPQAPDITFPALENNGPLCPVTFLRAYMTKTQTFARQDALFVHPVSGQPLTAGRLSFWLAKAIKAGDPLALKPAGHDIRKMGYSIAHFRQTDPQTILQNGFWHSPNVFVHKYLISCRPSTEAQFIAGRTRK